MWILTHFQNKKYITLLYISRDMIIHELPSHIILFKQCILSEKKNKTIFYIFF